MPPTLVLALALGAVPAAAAADASAEVKEGLSLFGNLEYDRAVVILGRALTSAELSPADRRAGLEALAYCYAILDDAVHADERFAALLDADPSFQVDPARSPRLRGAFARAKEAWSKGRQVGLALEPDSERLVGSLSGDPARIGSVVAIDEGGGEEPLRCERQACAGARPKARFRIEIRDHRGVPLKVLGPFDGRQDAGDGAFPWWGYLAIGAGALATGAIIVAAVVPRGVPSGSLGRFDLP